LGAVRRLDLYGNDGSFRSRCFSIPIPIPISISISEKPGFVRVIPFPLRLGGGSG